MRKLLSTLIVLSLCAIPGLAFNEASTDTYIQASSGVNFLDMALTGALTKALAMEPESARIWATLGWLYCDQGNQENAIAAMTKAVEFADERRKGNYQNTLKKFKEGIKDKTL